MSPEVEVVEEGLAPMGVGGPRVLAWRGVPFWRGSPEGALRLGGGGPGSGPERGVVGNVFILKLVKNV